MINQFPKQKPIRLSRNKMLKLNQEVLIRDNHTCQVPWCNSQNVDIPHHIIYKSRGGSDVAWNLVTLCLECHRRVHGSNDILTIEHQEKIPTKELIMFLENPVPYLLIF